MAQVEEGHWRHLQGRPQAGGHAGGAAQRGKSRCRGALPSVLHPFLQHCSRKVICRLLGFGVCGSGSSACVMASMLTLVSGAQAGKRLRARRCRRAAAAHAGISLHSYAPPHTAAHTFVQVPELGEIAQVDLKIPFNKDSSRWGQSDYCQRGRRSCCGAARVAARC